MYHNGYVPPQGEGERRRRAQRVPTVPPRVIDAAMTSQQGHGAPASAPHQRYTAPGGQGGYPPQGAWERYAPPQYTRPAPSMPQEDRQGYPPQLGYGQSGHRGEAYDQPARDMYGNPLGYPAQGYYQQGMPPEGQGGGEPPRKGHPVRTVLIILAVALVLAIAGAVAWFAFQANQEAKAVHAYDNVFCQGVYVDGIHLGGMTPEQGVTAVQAKAQERHSSWSVRLLFSGQLVTEITAEQLGMKTDIMDVMNQAWAQGHGGTVEQRKQAMEQLMQTPFEAYTAMPSGDTSVIDGILADIERNVYRAPQNAALVTFDPSQAYPFVFQNEVKGRALDTAPLKEKLYQMVSTMESGDVEIVPQEIQPTVTVADLKQNLVLRSTSQTPIDRKSTENRTNNIRRCFEKISGTVLRPGEKFSFNGVVGQRTLKNGFFEAIEYAYGEMVNGVGGGSCQASTTLYQAAVEAGLEIVTREPHSDAVSYASYGEDATVYWEGNRKIDLVFKNNTDHDIYIVAAVETDPSNSRRLVAVTSIYGESLGDVRYELQSKTVETIPAPTEPEIIKDKKQTYVTYTDEERQVRKAKEGYVVESYRVTYQNEQVIARELLYTDTYKAKTARIYVGTTERGDED